LNPIDTLPPITVITHVRKYGRNLVVQGTTSDNGNVKTVTVNGHDARALSPNFTLWEVSLPVSDTSVELIAKSIDDAGNAELTPHLMTLVVFE